jgi:hypothetical protein
LTNVSALQQKSDGPTCAGAAREAGLAEPFPFQPHSLSKSKRDRAADRRKQMSEKKGEGSYEGAEQFQKDQHKFAKEGPVESKAREAAEALDGKEAEELERARKATAKGSK